MSSGRPPNSAPASWYRLVRHYPSQISDFLSEEAAGRPRFGDGPEATRLWSGVSVWTSEPEAMARSDAFEPRGGFVVRLEVPVKALPVLRTTLAPGHHTLAGEPGAIFLRSVRNRRTSNAGRAGDGSQLEIWSSETGNLLAAFPNRREALAALRLARRENGDAYVAALRLLEFRSGAPPISERGDRLLGS